MVTFVFIFTDKTTITGFAESIGNSQTNLTETLLLLYEFETRAKLNDPKVETVLESVLELENVETKVLEAIAGKTKTLLYY